MLYDLAIIATYLFEMLTAYIFFAQQGELKPKKWVGWSIGSIGFACSQNSGGEYFLRNAEL